MGMYSRVRDCDITIKDELLLRNWLENCVSKDRKEKDEVPAYKSYSEELRTNLTTHKNVRAEEAIESIFEDRKIIQYWYYDFCLFLRDLAEHIEGTITLIYETEEEHAVITFKDSQAFVEIGVINWADKISIDEFAGLPDLTAKEKLSRKINKIHRCENDKRTN